MAYPDSLLVTRPGKGATSADDVFTPGGDSVIYDDGCDFQDDPAELTTERDGEPDYPRKAVVFLKDETRLRYLRLKDRAKVILGADGTVVEGRIDGIRQLDGRVTIGDLKWPT